MHAWVLSRFSHVWLIETPWIAARQIPLSMWLSWQEYWSELPFPPPEIWTILAYKKNKCLLNGDQVARESAWTGRWRGSCDECGQRNVITGKHFVLPPPPHSVQFQPTTKHSPWYLCEEEWWGCELCKAKCALDRHRHFLWWEGKGGMAAPCFPFGNFHLL